MQRHGSSRAPRHRPCARRTAIRFARRVSRSSIDALYLITCTRTAGSEQARRERLRSVNRRRPGCPGAGRGRQRAAELSECSTRNEVFFKDFTLGSIQLIGPVWSTTRQCVRQFLTPRLSGGQCVREQLAEQFPIGLREAPCMIDAAAAGHSAYGYVLRFG